jgi:hypothetical protein
MKKTRQAFLRFKGSKTQKLCAAEIGVSDKHLSRVLVGKVACGMRLAKRIEKWSDGTLTAAMFLFPE